MADLLPTPPFGVPLFDQANNTLNPQWQNFFNNLVAFIVTVSGAPTDAEYWLSKSDATLTNERNLGALATGLLFITVAAGIATPSSLSVVPLLRGGTNADLSGTGGTSQVLKQSSAGATVTVGQLATSDISGLAASTYTPTLTNVANVAASTAFACQWMQVGTTVTVSGKVDIDPTSATTLTQLGISLPVASTFATAQQCGGTAAAPAVSGYSAGILADTTNHRAELDFTTATDVANRSWYFSFTYMVV